MNGARAGRRSARQPRRAVGVLKACATANKINIMQAANTVIGGSTPDGPGPRNRQYLIHRSREADMAKKVSDLVTQVLNHAGVRRIHACLDRQYLA